MRRFRIEFVVRDDGEVIGGKKVYQTVKELRQMVKELETETLIVKDRSISIAKLAEDLP